MNTIEEPISNCNQFIDQDEERMNDLTEANWPVISQWIADIRDRPRLVIDNAIRDQALRYASNGWPIFPVPIGTKASHKSAEHSNGQPWGSTTDADEIRRNFKRWPNANVGVVTGEVSGIFVVETDTAEGHGEGVDGAAELAKLEAEHGALPPTREAISPSGSVHRYYRHPGPGIKVVSRKIVDGVDCKGDGGMVIAPPSVKPGKGVYSWRNNLAIAEAPAWLLDLVVAKIEETAPASITQQASDAIKQPRDVFDDIADEVNSKNNGGFSRAYLDAVLNDEVDIVSNTAKGGRNEQLNKSTFNLATLVGVGALTESEVEDAMLGAAIACSLRRDKGHAACMKTIASGMKSGKANPRPLPRNSADDITAASTTADERPANEVAPSNNLPIIQIKDGELSLLATKAEELLIAAGVPIYQRSGRLVRPIIETVDATRGRKTKIAQLKVLDETYLRDLLGRHARCEKYNARSKKMVPVNPPMEIAATVIARQGDWKFKAISGVISTPTMRPDGSLLTEQGYDEATGLLLVEPPPMPTIPDQPTREDALKALALLEDLLSEFPLVDDVAKACALSAMITPVVRGAFSVTPLHAGRAPDAGSGKSYLMDTVAAIAIGQPMPVMSTGANKEETEKRLGSALMKGQPLISIDNISGELGGDALCQIIERPMVDIRILGSSDSVRIEARGTSLFATGNNFVIVGDLCRRVISAALDPAVERPEFREFKGDPVKKILENRGAYIAAALIICRAYFVAGQPNKAKRLASFEGWSDIVRSALIWLGSADPVKSMEVAQAENPERIELSDLIAAWISTFGLNNRLKLSAVISKGLEMTRPDGFSDLEPANPELYAVLHSMAARATGKRGQLPDAAMLGLLLQRRKGQVIDGKRFSNQPHKRGAEWWVAARADPTAPAEQEPSNAPRF
jgi:hypothetical protein